MSEEALISEDQSHYEVSLTAGQAFLAFVLLLLSLAASFAFGMLIGRGQMDDRLTARKDAGVVNEPVASKKSAEPVAETAVSDDDFKMPPEETKVAAAPAPRIIEEPVVAVPARVSPPKPVVAVAHLAQLFSSADQKAAEAMAARLIDGGFTTAYVERGTNDKGPVYRVRVRFPSEAEARAAEPKLRGFSKEVWITKAGN